MLDKLPETIDDFSRRSMIIFPSALIDSILTSGKQIFIIQRSALQAYFVKDLRERPHGDIGPNAVKTLTSHLSQLHIPFTYMKNNINHVIASHNMIVMNKEEPKSDSGLILTGVSKALRTIPTKCLLTIDIALSKFSSKRNTVSIDYGFTLNKCDMLHPKNAVLDYDLPIHSSGVTEIDEVATVFLHANELLLQYEMETKNNNCSFGVKEGNWFQNQHDKFHSCHSNKIVEKLGIISQQLDWRLFGVTLVFYSNQLHLHRDVLNSMKDNYSMVVCFNHVIDSSTIPLSQQVPSLKKLEKETGSYYFNMSLLCYGRHCVDAVSDKLNARSLAKDRDPIVNDFFNRVLKDDSWEYESWLLHRGQNELKRNITVLKDPDVSFQIDTFTQSLQQSLDAQHRENELHQTILWAKQSVLPKFLYWSSYVTAFYRTCIDMELTIREAFEVYLFMCVETNGQSLIAHTFFWHLLRMDKSDFRENVRSSGSVYSFLTSIISDTVNR